jgi:lysozyme
MNESLRISDRGLALITHFEGLYLKAYQDPVGIWTIGYGHTGLRHNDGTVKRGRVITEREAVRLLRDIDMPRSEAFVRKHVVVGLKQHEFDALVSFSFNTGGLILKNGKPSTLCRLLNTYDFAGAARQFAYWNKADGKVLRGLTRRRHAEKLLFEGDFEAMEDFLD